MGLPESLEDHVEPEFGIAVVAAAALLSPKVRQGIRRGMVVGLSGLLMVSDSIVTLARRLTPVDQRAQDASFSQQLADEARIEQAKLARARVPSERQEGL